MIGQQATGRLGIWISQSPSCLIAHLPYSPLSALALFFPTPQGQQQDEPEGDNRLTDLDASRLPGTEIRQGRELVASEAEHICHPGEHRDHVPGADKSQAEVRRDAAGSICPQRGQADVAPNADNRQAD